LFPDWRELFRRTPDMALIDIDEYAGELDAIDASVRNTLKAHFGIESITPDLWGNAILKDALTIPFSWAEPIETDSVIVGINQRPIVPIPRAEPARLAVATLQLRQYWLRNLFFDKGSARSIPLLNVLKAMTNSLLKRKLELSPKSARDLVLLLNSPPITKKHEQAFEYLFEILKLLERSFSPPVPSTVRGPLKQLHKNLSRPIPRYSWEHRKKPRVLKRYQNACGRIERLLQSV
jgi:hypothetical protein